MAKTTRASDLATTTLPAAPAAPPARQQGGSYEVQPDGSAQRVAHTRDANQPDDTSAPAQPAASQE